MKLYLIINQYGEVKLTYTDEAYARKIVEALNTFHADKYILEIKEAI